MVLLVINLLLFRCTLMPLLSFMTQGNGHINMKEAQRSPVYQAPQTITPSPTLSLTQSSIMMT